MTSDEDFDDSLLDDEVTATPTISNCRALDVLLALRDGGIGRELKLADFCDPGLADANAMRAMVFDIEDPFQIQNGSWSTYVLLYLSIKALTILTDDEDSVSLEFESESVVRGGAGNDLRIWELIVRAAGDNAELHKEASQRIFNEVLLRTTFNHPTITFEEALQLFADADPDTEFAVEEVREHMSAYESLEELPEPSWTPKRGEAARAHLRSELIGADELLDDINSCGKQRLVTTMLWLCFYLDKDVPDADETFLEVLGQLNHGVPDRRRNKWSLSEARLLGEIMRCRMIWFAHLFGRHYAMSYFNDSSLGFVNSVCNDTEDVFVYLADLASVVDKIERGVLWELNFEKPEDPYGNEGRYSAEESLELAMVVIRWSEKCGSVTKAADEIWYWLHMEFGASDALDWMLCGVDLPTAIRERRAGRSPDETYGGLWALGIKPTKAAIDRWRGLGKDEISDAIDRGFLNAREYLPFAQSKLDIDAIKKIRRVAKRHLSASDVLYFHDFTRQGLSDSVALRWLKSGESDIKRIRQFELAGVSAKVAKEWRVAGFSLNETIWFKSRGIEDVEDGIGWLSISGNLVELEPWVQAKQFTPAEAKAWRDAGYGPKEAARWTDIGASADDARKWQDLGKSAAGLELWIKNGFTPDEARRWVRSDVNITPTLALRRRKAGIEPK